MLFYLFITVSKFLILSFAISMEIWQHVYMIMFQLILFETWNVVPKAWNAMPNYYSSFYVVTVCNWKHMT